MKNSILLLLLLPVSALQACWPSSKRSVSVAAVVVPERATIDIIDILAVLTDGNRTKAVSIHLGQFAGFDAVQLADLSEELETAAGLYQRGPEEERFFADMLTDYQQHVAAEIERRRVRALVERRRSSRP